MTELQLPQLNTDRIIGVYAKARYGKTNLIANILKRITQDWYVIMYDINYEQPKFRGLSFNKHLIFHTPEERNANKLEQLNKFIKDMRTKSSNFFIYIEDLDSFFDDATSLSKDAFELKDLVGRGGHQRVGFIYAAKQPRVIPLKVISATNLMYLGKFQQQDDVQALRNYATAQQLSTLENRYFIEYDDWTNQKTRIKADVLIGD